MISIASSTHSSPSLSSTPHPLSLFFTPHAPSLQPLHTTPSSLPPGVLHACEIADINCLKVANESTLIALSYGIFKSAAKLFSETEAAHTMFIDVGYTVRYYTMRQFALVLGCWVYLCLYLLVAKYISISPLLSVLSPLTWSFLSSQNPPTPPHTTLHYTTLPHSTS